MELSIFFNGPAQWSNKHFERTGGAGNVLPGLKLDLFWFKGVEAISVLWRRNIWCKHSRLVNSAEEIDMLPVRSIISSGTTWKWAVLITLIRLVYVGATFHNVITIYICIYIHMYVYIIMIIYVYNYCKYVDYNTL